MSCFHPVVLRIVEVFSSLVVLSLTILNINVFLSVFRCLKPYRLVCYIFSVGMEGLCCLFTPLLHSFPLLVPFAVLYGYFDGAYVALIPVVTSDVVGAPCLSSALGVVYFLHAIPYLISPPIGGEEATSATILANPHHLPSSAAIMSKNDLTSAGYQPKTELSKQKYLFELYAMTMNDDDIQ